MRVNVKLQYLIFFNFLFKLQPFAHVTLFNNYSAIDENFKAFEILIGILSLSS